MLKHETRLEWSGGRGFACHDGISIDLVRPPGRWVSEIHYTPGMQAEVRERDCDPRRLMTTEEAREADRWLRVMAFRVREAAGQLPVTYPPTTTTNTSKGDSHEAPDA